MTPLQRTRLEKAASDCGFERTPEFVDGALILRSAHFPESVVIYPKAEKQFELRAQEPSLLEGLGSAASGRVLIEGYGALYAALERMAVAARTRPDRLAGQFHEATAGMPQTTEAERLAVQRVGQGLFRDALLQYWRGRCCMTGLAVPELLRASHIKPWAACSSDEERLDVFNGLLLAPHLDALFDQGWITVTADGQVIVAEALDGDARQALSLPVVMTVADLRDAHRVYLEYHRGRVFKGKL